MLEGNYWRMKIEQIALQEILLIMAKIMLNSGLIGEQLAEDYLKRKGYKILQKNYRIKGGEIDIIALDSKILVFVEVKARNNDLFGQPVEAITSKKLKSIILAAQVYLQKNKISGDFRIDAIEVFLQSGDINHLQNITI